MVKIHHVGLDGTKIKSKISMNKLTNEQQLKIMKQHIEESIKLDEEEGEELGEESGNGIPETLYKEKFKEVFEKVNESSKDDRNKDKLRSSCKNILKQAG